MIAGFGLGGAFFSSFSTYLANPENKDPKLEIQNGSVADYFFDNTIAERFPQMMQLLALAYFLIGTLGLLLLGRGKDIPSANSEVPVKPHLKKGQFWVLSFMCFCSIIAGLYVSTVFKNFGNQKIDDDAFLTLTWSVASLLSCLSGFVWSQIMEWTSFRATYMSLLIVQIGMVVSLTQIASSKWLFLLWITVLLCCETGHYLLFATLFSVIYGPALGAKLYALFFFTISISGLVSFGMQYVVVTAAGYQVMFFIVTGMSVASLLIILKFDPEKTAKTRLVENDSELSVSVMSSDVRLWDM